MDVDLEGFQLFAAGPFGADGRDHLRLILVDRVEAWLRAYAGDIPAGSSRPLVERIVECCALVPITLDDSSAVDWRASSAQIFSGVPRIRIEKAINYTGNDLLFGLAPRGPLGSAPRAFVTATSLRFSATAAWDDFAHLQEAVERAEHSVRQFLCWQHLDVADMNRELPDIAAERQSAARHRGRVGPAPGFTAARSLPAASSVHA